MADRDGSDGYIAGEQRPSSLVQRLTQRYRSWPLWAKISAPVAALLLMGALIPNEASSTTDSPATTQVADATVVTSAATTSTPTPTTLAPATTIPATTLPATTLPATTLAPVTTPAPDRSDRRGPRTVRRGQTTQRGVLNVILF